MDETPRSTAATPAASEPGSFRKSGTGSRISNKTDVDTDRASTVVSVISDNSPATNPFKMPSDNDIFLLRDKERQKKKQERLRQRQLHVHEKTTYAARLNTRSNTVIHPPDSDQENQDEGDGAEEDKVLAVKEDPQFTLAVTRDRNVEKESLADYICKKREMFLVQYSLGVKRDEMRKLEEIAQAEERKLELAEQYLEEDAAMFDEFLKENDKNSVEAIKIAEAETKSKLEKVAEIKRINAQMVAIKSEISKYEDTLKEYQLYRRFLDNLALPEWQEERQNARQKRRTERRKEKSKEVEKKGKSPSDAKTKPVPKSLLKPAAVKGTVSRTSSNQADGTLALITTDDSGSDSEPELFFTDPHQLLDIFAELEEQNLSLIQNSQETEEALEEMKQTIKHTETKMEKETQILKEQIDKLNNAIKREEEKATDLETKAKLFSYGEFKSDDQDKMLSQLNNKVEDVYRSCIGDNEANISTLQMLTNIENRLEELFEAIELMPQDKVEAAEKAKDKERRLKLREEKLEQQRLHQEDRVRKALERAKADPKKQTGKRLVYRSEPPQVKKLVDTGADQASREEEELMYFFT